MKGSQESLTTVVVKETTWPSPRLNMHKGASMGCCGGRIEKTGYHGNIEEAVFLAEQHGQAAPANPSTAGSRQGLSVENWVTPRTSGTSTRPNKTTPRQGLTLIEQARANEWRTPGASDGEGGVMEMREGCAGKYKLRDHVVAVQKQEWRTPTVAEEKNQNTSKQIYLQNQVGATAKQWATPRSGKTTDENPETWQKRADAGQVATMPLTAQVKCWATPTNCDHKGASSPEACKKWEFRGQNLPEMVVIAEDQKQVKQWGTPAANDAKKQNVMCEVNSKQAGLPKSVGLELQKQWATPCSRDHHPNGQTEGSKTDLGNQVAAQWGTPTARDHKSGRGNEEREYKELTPMVERTQSGKLNPRWVETLMGLPVGWTMPSCASPVTIELTNCASSATESCLPPQSELFEF